MGDFWREVAGVLPRSLATGCIEGTASVKTSSSLKEVKNLRESF